MNATSDNMPLEVRESRHSSALRFKPTNEVLDGYLRCAPLAHALHRAAEAHQLAKIPLAGPVLDLGCGSGEFASLALEGRIEMGVDVDARALGKAERTGRYGAVRCADAARLPFADEQFQTVLAVSVLEHLTEPSLALAEALRVLRPGGRFVATIVLADLHNYLFYPRLLRRFGAAGLANGYCRLQDHLLRHRTLLSRSGWQELFSAAGFQAFAARSIVTPQLTASWDRLLLSALPYRLGLRCAWHPAWFRHLADHCYGERIRERSDKGSNLLVVARKSRSTRRLTPPVRRPLAAIHTLKETVRHVYAHS